MSDEVMRTWPLLDEEEAEQEWAEQRSRPGAQKWVVPDGPQSSGDLVGEG
jgi:hypothetical protein